MLSFYIGDYIELKREFNLLEIKQTNMLQKNVHLSSNDNAEFDLLNMQIKDVDK